MVYEKKTTKKTSSEKQYKMRNNQEGEECYSQDGRQQESTNVTEEK